MCCAGYEGLVGPGGEVPGHAGRGRHLRRGFQESHDGAVPENCAGGSVRATLGLSPLAGVLWTEIVNQVAPAGLTALLCLLMFDFPDDRL